MNEEFEPDNFQAWLKHYLQRVNAKRKERKKPSLSKGRFGELCEISRQLLSNMQAPDTKAYYRPLTKTNYDNILAISATEDDDDPDEDFKLTDSEKDNLKKILDGRKSINATNIDDIVGEHQFPKILTGRLEKLAEFQNEFRSNPSRIFQITGRLGDGRDHLTKIIIDWIRDSPDELLSQKNKYVWNIDFTGLWDRYGSEKIPDTIGEVFERDILDFILVEIGISSPRSHSGFNEKVNKEELNKDITELKTRLEEYLKITRLSDRGNNIIILAFLSLWPEGDSLWKSQKDTIIGIFGKLYESIMDIKIDDTAINNVCIVSSSSKLIATQGSYTRAFPLLSLDEKQLNIMSDRLFPGSKHAKEYIDDNFKILEDSAYTIDEWTLSIGNQINVQDQDLRTNPFVFKEPTVTNYSVDFDLDPNNEKNITAFQKYFDLLPTHNQNESHNINNIVSMTAEYPNDIVSNSYFNFLNVNKSINKNHLRSFLCILMLFNSQFSTGDVLRVLKLLDKNTMYETDSDTNSAIEWWQNPGTLRDYLQFLSNKGWLQVEFIPGKIDFSYRFRLSAKYYLTEVLKRPDNSIFRDRSNIYKFAFSKSLIDEIEGITYRGINFKAQIDAIHGRLSNLYLAFRYLKEISVYNYDQVNQYIENPTAPSSDKKINHYIEDNTRSVESMFKLLKILCSYFSSYAYWHLSVYLTNEFITTINNWIKKIDNINEFDEHRKYLESLLFESRLMFMAFNFYRDYYQINYYFDPKSIEKNTDFKNSPNMEIYSIKETFGGDLLLKSKFLLMLSRLINVSINDFFPDKNRLEFAKSHLLSAFRYACEHLSNLSEKKQSLFRDYANAAKEEDKSSNIELLIKQTHHSMINTLQQIALIKYWNARIEAQHNLEYIDSSEGFTILIGMFDNVIDFCARHHFYKELSLSYIWIARLALLRIPKEPSEHVQKDLLELAKSSIVMASSYSVDTPDRKIQNMLIFHKAWIHYKESILTKNVSSNFTDVFEKINKEYRSMGEKYWAVFNRLIFANEMALSFPFILDRSEKEEISTLVFQHLDECIGIWKNTKNHNMMENFTFIPSKLFIYLANQLLVFCESGIKTKHNINNENISFFKSEILPFLTEDSKKI
ncbi:MAG: hypothetical protein QM758_09510 [Armatimonas sp.]